jgi:hypothetical protein
VLRIVTGVQQSSLADHTEFGQIYNHPARTRDRIMPTNLYPGYLPPTGRMPTGFRAYNTPPIVTLNISYMGRYAYADMEPVERPLPWERIIK